MVSLNITAAFPCIEREFPRYLDFWKQIVRLESPSWDRAAVCAAADCIAQFAAARGFTVDRTPQPEAGDTLCITLPGTLDVPPVALLAHMDTVHPVGSFGDPAVREENGVLYGPGVFDCKGGIAAGLLCMDALRRCGAPHPEVRLVLDPDEENGAYIGEAGGQFIRGAVRGCMAALNLESGRDGSLTVGRKGVLRAELTVRGTAAHAGNDYFSGVSAIREAAHKILELERISSPEGITVNCGLIRGGSAVNTVPEDCTVDIDVRFKNETQQEEALTHLRRVAETAFVPGTSAPPWPALRETFGSLRPSPGLPGTSASRTLCPWSAAGAATPPIRSSSASPRSAPSAPSGAMSTHSGSRPTSRHSAPAPSC